MCPPKGLKIPGAEKLSLRPGALAPRPPVPDPARTAAQRSPGERLRYDASPASRPGRNRTPPEEIAIDIRIETLKPIQVARIGHVGPYSDVGPCFEQLFRWAASIGVPTGRVLTVSCDDPETVARERLRSDACVELRTEKEPPPGIVLGPVGEGRFAVYRLTGPYEGISGAYRRLFSEWLPGSGESMDDRPCMEIYRKSQMDTPPEHLSTDLCVPLRTPTPRG